MEGAERGGSTLPREGPPASGASAQDRRSAPHGPRRTSDCPHCNSPATVRRQSTGTALREHAPPDCRISRPEGGYQPQTTLTTQRLPEPAYPQGSCNER